MTVTLQQEHIGKYYVYISQDKYSAAYKVGYAVTYDGAEYWERDERYYETMQKAKRRYNDLKRKVRDE